MTRDQHEHGENPHLTIGELFDHSWIDTEKDTDDYSAEEISLMMKISSHTGVQATANGNACKGCAKTAILLELTDLTLANEFDMVVVKLKEEYRSLPANTICQPKILEALVKSSSEYAEQTDGNVDHTSFLVAISLRIAKQKYEIESQSLSGEDVGLAELLRRLKLEEGYLPALHKELGVIPYDRL